MLGEYILDGKRPVPEHDLMKWARWMEVSDRRVAKTTIGAVTVSTVFLGIDHSHARGARTV